MTVARLRREMSADEYMHWCTYYAIEAQDLEMQRAKRK